MSWFTKNWKKIVTVASLALNVLGGTGVIPPAAVGTAGKIINALSN